MDIYILREGKEIGPFPESKVELLLGQGSVAPADLSWCSGMSKWLPLSEAFPTLASPVEEEAEPPAEPEPLATEDAEPATARQRALLHYLGIRTAPDLTKAAAAVLVSDATENAAYTVRLAQWQHERLKLHPDIFADEVQARRDHRAHHYHHLTQTAGATHFSRVTLAHAQTLVSYLDLNFPNWDANEATAVEDFFFPAIAEKFPQLVSGGWQGGFKRTSVPRLTPEIPRGVPTQFHEAPRRRSHLAAAVRGVFFGALILGLAWFVHRVMEGGKSSPTPEPAAPAVAAAPASEPSQSAAAPAPAPTASDPPTETKPQETEKPAEPAMASTPPSAEPAPTPEPTPSAPPSVAPAAPAQPAGPPARFTPMRLTRAYVYRGPYGNVTIQPGNTVRFLAIEGQNVRVQYGKDMLLIPAASTNLHELPPAPLVPGLDPSSLPAPLSAPPDPLAPPPTAKDSLFGTPKPAPIPGS